MPLHLAFGSAAAAVLGFSVERNDFSHFKMWKFEGLKLESHSRVAQSCRLLGYDTEQSVGKELIKITEQEKNERQREESTQTKLVNKRDYSRLLN